MAELQGVRVSSPHPTYHSMAWHTGEAVAETIAEMEIPPLTAAVALGISQGGYYALLKRRKWNVKYVSRASKLLRVRVNWLIAGQGEKFEKRDILSTENPQIERLLLLFHADTQKRYESFVQEVLNIIRDDLNDAGVDIPEGRSVHPRPLRPKAEEQ